MIQAGFCYGGLLGTRLDADEEWAFFERFILAVRAPNGRKPTSHRVVLDGIFLDRSHWCPMAGPARRVRQMVERLPAVSALDIGGSLGGHHGRPKPERGSAGCPSNDRQHCSSGPSSGSKRKKGTPRQGFGRSRGGFTTKIHLRVNAAGLPMRTEITPGQTSDYTGFDLVMADNLPEPSVLLADRGYDADSIRKKMETRNVLTQIPMRKSRKMRRRGSFAVFIAKSCRAQLQQTEECSPCRNPLRQNRRELPWLHRHHVNPPLAPSFVNMT